jgi:hypothetical protein
MGENLQHACHMYQENEEIFELERVEPGLSNDFWIERAWQNETSIVPKPFKACDLKYTLLWCKTFQGFKYWNKIFQEMRTLDEVEKRHTNG